MIILALDTATEACSVAISREGEIESLFELAPRQHNERLLPMITELLAKTDLRLEDIQLIAFGQGPGSFTGVRLAVGVAQGLGLGLDRPLFPVSTLKALALEALRESDAMLALPAIDARMDEVYVGCYRRIEGDHLESVSPEAVLSPEVYPFRPSEPAIAIGSGWDRYSELLFERSGIRIETPHQLRFPHAASIARLAAADVHGRGGIDPAQAQPVYLRDDVARKPAASPASSKCDGKPHVADD